MKYIITICVLLIINSCKKDCPCYECEGSYGFGQTIHREVCEGDADYADAVEFGAVRDTAGNPIPCHLK